MQDSHPSEPFSSDELSFLEELVHAPSPVGSEHAGQEVWCRAMAEICERVELDAYGSAAAYLNARDGAPLVMIEAHCDEIGLVVQHITEDGYVFVNRLGGSDSTIARARKVRIHSRGGTVFGVTGHKAIHLQDQKNGGGKEPAWKEIFVDIGASNRQEALERVQVGDPVTYADQFERMGDRHVVGRALDNRLGGFILWNVIRRLREHRVELAVRVVAANSVQEEVGGFGARMLSYRCEPDLALVTDVTHATDIPGLDPKEHGLIELGKGPSVQHGGASHPGVVRMLENAAGRADIALQHEATSVRTGTDTDSIFHQRKGIPSALVSIPLRYMHSPVEMAHLDDVRGVVDLMVEVLKGLDADAVGSVQGRVYRSGGS